MGVRGAAAATVISRVVEMIILIPGSRAFMLPSPGRLKRPAGLDLVYVSRFFRIVLPVLVNEITWSLGVSLQNLVFARTHTDAIAAFNIVNTVNQLTWVLFIGLGNGVAVLIGKKIGEGDEKSARDYASRIVRFSPLLALCVTPVLLLISRFLPLVFNVNENVIALAKIMFILLCVFYPFRSVNMAIVVGICRSGGDTVFCIIYDILFLWAFALPLSAFAAFVLHAPVWVLFICINSEECLKLLLGLWRLRTGRWLRNVTTGI
jgi:Na+-driven multidrug efflux pump